jgi:hypothetical protein
MRHVATHRGGSAMGGERDDRGESLIMLHVKRDKGAGWGSMKLELEVTQNADGGINPATLYGCPTGAAQVWVH